MKFDLTSLKYNFLSKPLLIGGQAKEYYEIRKSEHDIDLVICLEDYEKLSKLYPESKKDLWGDLGVCVGNFEIWKSICLFDYDFLSSGAIETDEYKIISLEKLLFLTALGIKKEKYRNDLELIVDKVLDNKYKNVDTSKYK